MAEWISVEERLPTSIDDVWVVVDDYVGLGNYAAWAKGWVRWDEQGEPYHFLGITHWQPCNEKPEPPQG